MTQEIDETIDHELEYDITESSCETEYPNSPLELPPYNDIGNYIHQAKSIESICQTISNLQMMQSINCSFIILLLPMFCRLHMFVERIVNSMFPGLKSTLGYDIALNEIVYFVVPVHFS